MRDIKPVLCAAAIGSAGLLTNAAAASETVNVGMCVSWPGYSMLHVAQEAGLTDGLQLNLTIFEDPLGGHAALAVGQIDVYACTADYTPLIVERGTNVALVALTNPSYGVDHIILAPEVDASTLSGRRVAAPQAYIGSLLMALWLDSEGISPDDVDWVNLNADEAVGPMLSGDLAAAYMYEPWISRVLAARPGARSVVNTADPDILESGIFMDALFMNTTFMESRRDAARAVLQARWDGAGHWHARTAETNRMLAEFLQWPEEDIGHVIGDNGKYFDGGIYMFDFDESARACGVLDGALPLGLENGFMEGAVARTNEWWIRLGLMQNEIDASAGVDCSLMAELVEGGYRQSFAAR